MTKQALDLTQKDRVHAGTAHYRGDVTADLLADPAKGPDLFGQLHIVTVAAYDLATDRTTATLAYATESDVDEYIAAHPVDLTAFGFTATNTARRTA